MLRRNLCWDNTELAGVGIIVWHLSVAVKGHIRKGHALLALKDNMKSMQAFQDALDIDPKNAVSMTVLDLQAIALHSCCMVVWGST